MDFDNKGYSRQLELWCCFIHNRVVVTNTGTTQSCVECQHVIN